MYYGARTPAHAAYADAFAAWEAAGVSVLPIYSQEGGGYVQDAFMQVGGRGRVGRGGGEGG